MEEIVRKFKFKADGIVINAPQHIATKMIELGFANAFDKKVKSANTLIFVNNNHEFTSSLKSHLKNIEPDSVLWFAYPKGTSGIKTDINRDTLRVTGEDFGITAVSAISIDTTWSALRFRPIEKVGKK